MFKKVSSGIIFLLVILFFTSRSEATRIDKSHSCDGIVCVKAKERSSIAVRISKGGDKKDFLVRGEDSFPLEFGEGEYDILILEGVGGNKYKRLRSEKVVYKAENKNSIYLQSIQGINWNEDMGAIQLAEKLSKGLNTPREKLEAVYGYITDNIKYDYEKANKVKPGYIPNIDSILKESKGICYDYSVLLAAMLRSLGIPTKVVEGYKDDIDVLHAWNQVYIDDKWLTIDTTYNAGRDYPMVKDPSEYTSERSY